MFRWNKNLQIALKSDRKSEKYFLSLKPLLGVVYRAQSQAKLKWLSQLLLHSILNFNRIFEFIPLFNINDKLN